MKDRKEFTQMTQQEDKDKIEAEIRQEFETQLKKTVVEIFEDINNMTHTEFENFSWWSKKLKFEKKFLQKFLDNVEAAWEYHKTKQPKCFPDWNKEIYIKILQDRIQS